MAAIAAALAAALVATIVVFAGLIRSMQRDHARRLDLLVNQILHLSGRTWTPPPADEWQPAREGEPLVRDWTPTPEQQPLNL